MASCAGGGGGSSNTEEMALASPSRKFDAKIFPFSPTSIAGFDENEADTKIPNDDLDVRLFCLQVLGIDYDRIPPSVTVETDEEITITIERLELMCRESSRNQQERLELMCRESSTVMTVAKIDRLLVDIPQTSPPEPHNSKFRDTVCIGISESIHQERVWESPIVIPLCRSAPCDGSTHIGFMFEGCDSISKTSEPIFDARLLCLDDSRLNENQTDRGSAELPKPLKIAKACCKLSFGRHHGRPPDHTGTPKYAASALEAPSHGGISVCPLPALVHQVNVLRSLPATNLVSQFTCPHSVSELSRKAGIRAAMKSPPSSATAWRQMTSIEPLVVKTSIIDALKSTIGSIPRPYQNNPPFGSIFSSFLADSGVSSAVREAFTAGIDGICHRNLSRTLVRMGAMRRRETKRGKD